MDQKVFENLNPGDLVRPKLDHRVFVVTGNYGEHVTAATTVDMTNPIEWELISKSHNK